MHAQVHKNREMGKWISVFVKLTPGITSPHTINNTWDVDSLNKTIQGFTSCYKKQIKRVLLFCCGSGRLVGDVVQSPSESLVRRMLPWAQMSSQDQYGITAPQIQTLTLHYIGPVPLQDGKRHIESISSPLVLAYKRSWGVHVQERAENVAKATHTSKTMHYLYLCLIIQPYFHSNPAHFNPTYNQI